MLKPKFDSDTRFCAIKLLSFVAASTLLQSKQLREVYCALSLQKRKPYGSYFGACLS